MIRNFTDEQIKTVLSMEYTNGFSVRTELQNILINALYGDFDRVVAKTNEFYQFMAKENLTDLPFVDLVRGLQ